MFLPQAPSLFEKYRYLDSNKTFYYSLGVVSLLLLTTGQIFFSIESRLFVGYLAFVFSNFSYLALSYGIGIFSKPFDMSRHDKSVAFHEIKLHPPDVDVYIPTCGEAVELLENTFSHAAKMRKSYPKAHIFVLDDMKRPEVKLLSQKYNFTYFTRANNELKKAGNLRAAFQRTDAPFLLIIDADFAVREDVIWEMIPYFAIDSNIAIVQTPQFFEVRDEASWVEKGASYVQELFYRLIQVNRNHFGGSICVGTNALYRRLALKPYGGTAPIGYSEDVHTGFFCLKDGWKVKYIPINLGKGVCPDTLKAFFMQQYRWCMGSFTLFLNPEFWTSRLTLPQFCCYLSGMLYYMNTAMGVFLCGVPSMVLIWFFPKLLVWWSLFFTLPSFVFGTFALAYWTKAKWGLHAILIREMTYWAHVFALFDRVRGSVMEWQATNAKVVPQRYPTFVILFCSYSSLYFIFILLGFAHSFSETAWFNFIPSLLFAAIHFAIRATIMIQIWRERK